MIIFHEFIFKIIAKMYQYTFYMLNTQVVTLYTTQQIFIKISRGWYHYPHLTDNEIENRWLTNLQGHLASLRQSRLLNH